MGSGKHRVLPSTLPRNRENGQFITHNRTFLKVKMGIIIRENRCKMRLSQQKGDFKSQYNWL